ncbi:hypothetical protein [Pseudomonas piscis]|uniref:hypothetical protein n=1 Tax=Pseudomonas piscis TaxID=2614538 RepID=UPI0021D5CDBB|nr:hypothetical protein [Pseudomonas piscis]MCU7649995.1 hypothetical protein [Pseudomonas piscis]
MTRLVWETVLFEYPVSINSTCIFATGPIVIVDIGINVPLSMSISAPHNTTEDTAGRAQVPGQICPEGQENHARSFLSRVAGRLLRAMNPGESAAPGTRKSPGQSMPGWTQVEIVLVVDVVLGYVLFNNDSRLDS